MIKRSVISVAVGKEYYLNLGYNLIQSFLLWNYETSFLLLTDNVEYFDSFKENKQVIVKSFELSKEERSFAAKLNIFDHAIAEENLFIDCDCLVYKNLDNVFDRLFTNEFTVIGHNSFNGNFFCNVEEVIRKFNLTTLPKFVGSIYYFKNSEKARSVFEYAKQLKSSYDLLGFIRLRGRENEEPLIAVAMAINNLYPFEDDGRIKADRMFFKSCTSNVLKGEAFLKNTGSPMNIEYCNLLESCPAILHFNDAFSEKAEYLCEQYRLKSVESNSLLLETFIYVKFFFPEIITRYFKKLLRPVYHFLWGPSKIEANKRI